MPSPALFGISVAFGLTVWGALVWHYIWPALKERPSPENLRPILFLHGFRFLGLAFLVPGVVSPELPAAFAQPVAYGDLISAMLALLALTTLGTRAGTMLTWVFNVFGTSDLLFAFYQGGLISLPATQGLLGAGYFILTAYVPLLLVTHGLAFRILLRTQVGAPARNKLSRA
jgi:Na+/phosphate symporter